MSLFLLLTTDPSLQKDLEVVLSPLPNPVTFIQAGSWGELDSCLESIRDVKAVIIDTRIFPAPDDYDWPMICLVEQGTFDKTHPTFSYPFNDIELMDVISSVLAPSQKDSTNSLDDSGGITLFFSKVIKEIAHDLNNQFTTLRGHLPLIQETCPEEAETISDLILATERATKLTHMLESMDPDTLPAPESFLFKDLLTELSSYGKKIMGPDFEVDLKSDNQTFALQGDPAYFCLLLLQTAWLYSIENCNIVVSNNLSNPDEVQVLFTPDTDSVNSEHLRRQVKHLNTLHRSGHLRLKLVGNTIVCSLPR